MVINAILPATARYAEAFTCAKLVVF